MALAKLGLFFAFRKGLQLCLALPRTEFYDCFYFLKISLEVTMKQYLHRPNFKMKIHYKALMK